MPPRRPGFAGPLTATLLALAWFAFWLWGQRFYDDDWFRWLNPGRQLGWGEVLGQLLRPFPPDWGFLDRPAVMLSFKLSDSLFGPVAWPLFAAKAVVAAALTGLLFAATRELASRAGASSRGATVGAGLAAALFATAEPTFASLAWASDSDLVAQLCVAASLLLYLRLLERDEGRRWPLLLLLFTVALVGYKTKGTAKIIPLVLIGHLAWTARDRLRAFAPLLLGLMLVLVPWGRLLQEPLPFLVDFGGDEQREWFYWRSANVESFTSLTLGGGLRAWPFGARTGLVFGLLEILSPFGLAALALAIGVGIRRLLGGASRPAKLLLVWLTLGLLLFSGYPRIPDHLLSRYLAGFFVPLSCLLGACVAVGLSRAGVARWLAIGAVAALLLQCAAGFADTSTRKRSWGCQVAVADLARGELEAGLRGATVGLLDLPDTGWVETGNGNRYETIESGRPDAATRLRRLARSPGGARLLTARPLAPGGGWDLEREIRPAWSLHRRLVGPPLGPCERYVYRPGR